MAELIPLEYRVRAMRRRLVGRWIFIGTLVAMVSGASLTWAYGWMRTQNRAYESLAAERQGKSVLIAQARALRERRLDLASRMNKMQELKNDKVLLSLLRNISSGFSASDCLEYVSVEAHNVRGKESDNKTYSVRINGLTASDSSHADLLNRLTEIGQKSVPPISITPESLRREPLLDGQVMRFQILCEPPRAASPS